MASIPGIGRPKVCQLEEEDRIWDIELLWIYTTSPGHWEANRVRSIRLTTRLLILKSFPAWLWHSLWRESGNVPAQAYYLLQIIGKSSSVHDLALGRIHLPLGKPHPRCCDDEEDLTQRGHKCKVLHHHIMVQEPLSFIKQSPLLPWEVDSHILKGHITLSHGKNWVYM